MTVYIFYYSDHTFIIRVEKVVPIEEIGAFLSQHLPGEVNDVLGIGLNKAEDIDGEAAFINVDGSRTLNYEFRISLEIVSNGAGQMIQLANITNDGTYP